MRLEWSVLAFEDRLAIFDHIEADSPRAAILTDGRILDQVRRLKHFPGIGRPGRIVGTRELIVNRTPYIVAYRVAGDKVVILRVLHGAQMWPAQFERS